MLSELEKIATRKQYDFLNASINEKISDNNKIDVKIVFENDVALQSRTGGQKRGPKEPQEAGK